MVTESIAVDEPRATCVPAVVTVVTPLPQEVRGTTPTGCVSVRSAFAWSSVSNVSCFALVANPVMAAGGVKAASCAAVRTTGTDAAASA